MSDLFTILFMILIVFAVIFRMSLEYKNSPNEPASISTPSGSTKDIRECISGCIDLKRND